MNQGHENSAIRSRIARVRRASVRRRLLWGLALLVAAGGGGVLIGFQLAREAPPEPRVADARAPEPERTNGEPSEPAHSAGRTSERLPEAPAPRTRQGAAVGRTRIGAGALHRTRPGAKARSAGSAGRTCRAASGRARSPVRPRRRAPAGTRLPNRLTGRFGRKRHVATSAGRGSTTPSRRDARVRLDRGIAPARTRGRIGTDRPRQGEGTRSTPRRRRRFGAPAPGRRATGGRRGRPGSG